MIMEAPKSHILPQKAEKGNEDGENIIKPWIWEYLPERRVLWHKQYTAQTNHLRLSSQESTQE